MIAAGWLGLASAADRPTVAEWTTAWGEPSKSVALTDRTRGPDEPLLLYWMQTQAAPLGVGPAVPGTLVANFTAAAPLADSPLLDFTFLAVADPQQTRALVKDVRRAGWIADERDVEREGGTFHEVALALPDGRTGVIAIRTTAAAGAMADGRPSPSMWIRLGP